MGKTLDAGQCRPGVVLAATAMPVWQSPGRFVGALYAAKCQIVAGLRELEIHRCGHHLECFAALLAQLAFGRPFAPMDTGRNPAKISFGWGETMKSILRIIAGLAGLILTLSQR